MDEQITPQESKVGDIPMPGLMDGTGAGMDGSTDAQSELLEDDANKYVTFFIENEAFAFPLESVLEIIRVPSTVRVPLTPSSLLGLANLRGTVLPVLETRSILSLSEAAHTDATRVVVVDCGKPVGLVVDRVERVISVEQNRIESKANVNSTVQTDLLTGVVKDSNSNALLQLLDVGKIVGIEFDAFLQEMQDKMEANAAGDLAFSATKSEETEVDDDVVQLVTFLTDKEEYALDISQVEEIVRVPEEIQRVPNVEDHVLGLMNLRDRLLALVSLRKMFSLPEAEITDQHRIVVANIRNGKRTESVGIVVDEVREVLSVTPHEVEELPELLKQGGDYKEVTGVCRLGDGERLISILSADVLFQNPAVKAAMEEAAQQDQEEGESEMQAAEQLEVGENTEEIQLVVFHLGDEEYGAPIYAVSEIIRVPDKMTRVPKTPDFIEGMVNLRGTVLPVLDMRTRFNLDRMDRNDKQRILVLELKGVHTGFIVDSVSEVLRLGKHTIEVSPKMSNDQTRIMGNVANLKEHNRMIMVLSIEELLNEEELEHVANSIAPGRIA